MEWGPLAVDPLLQHSVTLCPPGQEPSAELKGPARPIVGAQEEAPPYPFDAHLEPTPLGLFSPQISRVNQSRVLGG